MKIIVLISTVLSSLLKVASSVLIDFRKASTAIGTAAWWQTSSDSNKADTSRLEVPLDSKEEAKWAFYSHSLHLCNPLYRVIEVRLGYFINIRPLSDLHITIPKLFGKHIKIEEQKKALEKPTSLAIGVPNRVLKLAEEGILDLSNLSLLIIDMKEYEW